MKNLSDLINTITTICRYAEKWHIWSEYLVIECFRKLDPILWQMYIMTYLKRYYALFKRQWNVTYLNSTTMLLSYTNANKYFQNTRRHKKARRRNMEHIRNAVTYMIDNAMPVNHYFHNNENNETEKRLWRPYN